MRGPSHRALFSRRLLGFRDSGIFPGHVGSRPAPGNHVPYRQRLQAHFARRRSPLDPRARSPRASRHSHGSAALARRSAPGPIRIGAAETDLNRHRSKIIRYSQTFRNLSRRFFGYPLPAGDFPLKLNSTNTVYTACIMRNLTQPIIRSS
jgi:hypothetical protein